MVRFNDNNAIVTVAGNDIIPITDISDATDDKKISLDQIKTYTGVDSKQELIPSATIDNIASFDTDGQVEDSGIAKADITTEGNTFNGNSQLVQTTAGGLYPALNGSLINNINAPVPFALNSGNVTAGESDILYAPGSGSAWETWIQPNYAGLIAMGAVITGSCALPDYFGQVPLILDGNPASYMTFEGSWLIVDIKLPYQIRVNSVTLFNGSDGNKSNVAGVYCDSAETIPLAADRSIPYADQGQTTFTPVAPILTDTIRLHIKSISGSYGSLGEFRINAERQVTVSTATSIFFKVGGSYPALEARYADKTQEVLTSLVSITGLSTNGTYTVLKEKGQNPVVVLSSTVTQGKTFEASPTDGDYHCLTATGLQTYKRISGAWVETQYVPLGGCVVAGGVITSVFTNRYNVNGYNGAGHNIVETYVNGTSWYRIYSDGWIEQGDTAYIAGNRTITLLKPFKTANYNVSGCCNLGTTYMGILSPTTTNFTLSVIGANSWNWQASGY